MMPLALNNLLDEPIFGVRLTTQPEPLELSLPQVCEALWRKEVTSFMRLRTHQRQSWASFLSQLMAMGLARHGHTPEQAAGLDASQWREVLVGLSRGSEEAWHLIVEDVSKPAFMQPPIPEGSRDTARYKDPYETPDELDMLLTAKNHDVKRSLMHHAHSDQWVYGMVSLQTMEGFLGRGNYGIARMNGGFANRPKVGLSAGLSWSARQRRDTAAICMQRQHDQTLQGYDSRGVALLWLEPWDGESQIALQSCDPHFIEICRRLRMTGSPTDPRRVWRANTKAARVDIAKDLNGITHDPWTPINHEKKDSKALTVNGSGYHYDLMRKILASHDYDQSYALYALPEEQDLPYVYVIGEALVRGQGITEGLHERIIPVPRGRYRRGILPLFDRRDAESKAREQFAKRAEARAALAGTVRSKMLYAALMQLTDKQVDAWTQSFGHEVDACFFEDLWASAELSEQDASLAWEHTLHRLALHQLTRAIESLPLSTTKRWRQISNAHGVFRNGARKHLPHYIDTLTRGEAS